MKIFSRVKKGAVSVWLFAMKHKIISLIITILIIYGGYAGVRGLFSGNSGTQYVLAQAQTGTLISSVSASGQISMSTQLDIKPQVSGNVISIAVAQGQQVKAGQLIMKLDPTDAEKAVRDAQANLEAAKLSLAKLEEPPTQLSITQAQNALAQAQQSLQSAQNALIKDYSGGFTSVSNAFIDLPGVMTGISNILYGTNINNNQPNAYAYYDLSKNYNSNADQILNDAINSYQTALTTYNQNLSDYTGASIDSSSTVINSLISETYNTAVLISTAARDTKNLLDMADSAITNTQGAKAPAILTTHENNIQSYIGTVNNHLNDLLSAENSIQSDEDAITNASSSIMAGTQSLEELQAGADPLSIQSAQLSVQQAQNALLDAQQTLAEYSITAPFDGTIAQIDVIVGDPASPGSAVATIITSKSIADISLNEVDAAKLKIGDKATLTFDAIPDLTIAGDVSEIDTIGTVSQGVVNYGVQIALETQDSRIKPGMTVNAAVVTNVDQNVLMVPNSAVKSLGNTNYVEVMDVATSSLSAGANGQYTVVSSALPGRKIVQIGDANDSETEILSGLNEGDLVVVQSAAFSGSAQTSNSAQRGGVGGNFRAFGL
ncbi:MAG: efflux RND transporter periplasmic adaptor subunit [Patescibacteria group bacterium]|nr:efflux RND transporter periplasmic adaptor subunit [Patescibacteria group bacterium]